MKNPFDLYWIYDTSFTIEVSVATLEKLSPNNAYISSRVYCSKVSETQVEIMFKQPKSSGKIYCSKFIADFYQIETGKTVIVLHFVKELFGFLPCIPIEEADALFIGLFCARRRKN